MNNPLLGVREKSSSARIDSCLPVKVFIAAASLGLATIAGNAFRFGSALTLLDVLSFAVALTASLLIFAAVLVFSRYFSKSSIVSVVFLAIYLEGIFLSSGLMPSRFFVANLNGVILIVTSFAYFYFCSVLFLTNGKKAFTVIAFLLICVPPGLICAFVSERNTVMQDVVTSDLAPDISAVDFKVRPDIYLIGLLSASPEKVLLETLGKKDFKLERTLADTGFRNFNHVFSAETTTRKSYDAMLAISRSYAAQLSESEISRGKQFSGNVYSPFFDIFKNNGYKITTLTEDYKFGYTKGIFIDDYIVNATPSICSTKNSIVSMRKNYVFLGGCLVRRMKFFSDYRSGQGGATALLVERIISRSEDDQPNLLLAHLKPPVHAPAGFSAMTSVSDIEKFKARYVMADNQAAHNVLQIFNAIQSTNKNFIVLVFGDRGVGLLNKTRDDASSSELLLDRKAVLVSIFPAEACSHFINDSVTTTPQVFKGLVSCLSGQNIFPE